ncbi:MAG: UDP-3-O-(3-hydroxymyristoyl)glucosamine N-acyltransferase [Flavobacteriales bacterium]|nr:UDP-3-O-(3-hydroxymyristoyl)glucosamine N-acyltransferase [Flavobacteriales bacterium]
MILTAGVIAELIGGSVDGDPNVQVSTVSPIDRGSKGSLSFLANPKYTDCLYNTEASIVIVKNDFPESDKLKPTLIRVADPYSSFAVLLEQYDKMNRPKAGIHPSAIISESAVVGENVSIAAGVVIEEGAKIGEDSVLQAHTHVGVEATLGKNCTLHSGARVLHKCIVGDNCKLHAGVIIGSDGFGFAPQDSEYSKIPQIGNVVLEDNVEVGANTAIDRATMGSTIIRKGVKLDNLIQVAHNVEIGEHTVIAAQTGIAGSTVIGKRCMIGGQVGIIGHLTIGDNVKIAAQSGIGSNLKDNAIVQGSPAFEVGNYRRSYVSFRKLPQIIKGIEQKLNDQQ